jgi:LPPG:FO 2-phospho-L-lactate transferase
MAALKRLDGPSWFNLGDGDLATHTMRTQMLGEGASLSAVTRALCRRFDIAHAVVPMSDAPVRTIVHTADAALAFQDYFVRLQCAPAVTAVTFTGAEAAKPSSAFAAVMADPKLKAVVICPSNPLLSIDPILAIPGVRDWLSQRRIPVVAVSPLVGGAAIKGPAAKIFRELGRDVSVRGVADHYRGLIDGLVIDTVDAPAKAELEALGLQIAVVPSVMKSKQDQAALAAAVLAFAAELAGGTRV